MTNETPPFTEVYALASDLLDHLRRIHDVVERDDLTEVAGALRRIHDRFIDGLEAVWDLPGLSDDDVAELEDMLAHATWPDTMLENTWDAAHTIDTLLGDEGDDRLLSSLVDDVIGALRRALPRLAKLADVERRALGRSPYR